jgi:hypothetical protein
MLINLVPEFFAALAARDPLQAYHRYLDEHRSVLAAYWHNYVINLDSPHAEGVMLRALAAQHRDLEQLLERVDVAGQADDALARCQDVFELDHPVHLYRMVGVGAANAGELVVQGNGIAFVCLEHFTGRPNPDTFGMGLPPELLPLWIGHEVAHLVRYLSPASQAEMARVVRDAHGYYDYWESASRVSLRELLVNEGLAVAAAQAVAPGHEPWEYLGYSRRQYRRLRELDAFLSRAVRPELAESGLGFRLRYLSGGMSPTARLVNGKVVPERSGYYLGRRMVESLVGEVGIARALRAAAGDFQQAEERATGAQTA